MAQARLLHSPSFRQTLRMRINAVVLDMDGLMLDTEPLYKTAWQAAAHELGFRLDDAAYMPLIGRPTHECETELLSRFGPAFPLSEFRLRWPELWRTAVSTHGIARKQGLDALLALFKERQIPVAIATSSDAEHTAHSLRCAGLLGGFTAVVTGDQVPRGKPAPDIYLEAARRLSRDPSECVAIEDSDAGVIAAASAGMTTLCVPDLKPPSQDAIGAALCVLSSLDDVRNYLSGYWSA